MLQGLQSSSTATQELATWVAPDGLRMLLRAGELTPDDIAQLESFDAEHEEIRMITGTPMIFNELNMQVTQSQIQSLLLAFGLILIVLLVTLRSLRAAIAGLVPIVITVLGVLGFLAASGTNLNIVTAFLSSICIGVGIDYCIHIISGIHYFRKRGSSNQESVRSALSVVAGPVLANALGIAVGMSILFFAPLKLYTEAAAVLVVAMVLSAMGALLLIPVFYSGGGGQGSNDPVPCEESIGAGPDADPDVLEQL
jgi:predicted RND superfamily exporter protein